jgi:hypothetical protein
MNESHETKATSLRGAGGEEPSPVIYPSPEAKTPTPGRFDMPCWRQTVYPSDGYEWNGWTKQWKHKSTLGDDEVDRWIDDEWAEVREPASFVAGIYFDVFLHLADCEKCRKFNAMDEDEAVKGYFRLKEEWEKVIR